MNQHDQHNQSQPCCNVMEILVAQEIDRLIQAIDPDVAVNLNRVEAIAYALNRLPALYATTEEGWQWQMERAQSSLKGLIEMAAQWGVEEAQRKSKPFSTPLDSSVEARSAEVRSAMSIAATTTSANLNSAKPSSPESHIAQQALEDLKVLLGREDLSWENLVTTLKQVLQTTAPEARLSLLHAVRGQANGHTPYLDELHHEILAG